MYSPIFQQLITALREQVKQQLTNLGNESKKPMIITDYQVNDIALLVLAGILQGETNLPDLIATAYQAVYAINQEE